LICEYTYMGCLVCFFVSSVMDEVDQEKPMETRNNIPTIWTISWWRDGALANKIPPLSMPILKSTR
jgi:hypothetical protein